MGDKRCLLFRLDTGSLFSAPLAFLPVFRAWLRNDDSVCEAVASELWSVPRYVAKDRLRSMDLRLNTPVEVSPADVQPEIWPQFVCSLNVGVTPGVTPRRRNNNAVPRPKAPLKDVVLRAPNLGLFSWTLVLGGSNSDVVLRFAEAVAQAHGGIVTPNTTLAASRDPIDHVRPCVVLMTAAKRGQVGVVLSRRDPVEAMEHLLQSACSESALSALDAFRAVARLVFEAPCYAVSAPLTEEGLRLAVAQLGAWGRNGVLE